ncbi:MAG TPA: hypothetical protein PLC42_00400, partial [Parachlamydiaceae bacterium]|nr:hypothetical protein [Parachlamydiaceae bacterium]
MDYMGLGEPLRKRKAEPEPHHLVKKHRSEGLIFQKIPKELIQEVFYYLNWQGLGRLSQTSKKW